MFLCRNMVSYSCYPLLSGALKEHLVNEHVPQNRLESIGTNTPAKFEQIYLKNLNKYTYQSNLTEQLPQRCQEQHIYNPYHGTYSEIVFITRNSTILHATDV